MNDTAAATAESLDFRVIQLSRMYCHERRIQQSERVQVRERSLAGFLDAVFDFLRRFVDMHVHGDVELVG